MWEDIVNYFCVAMQILLWNVRVKTHFQPKYLLRSKYLGSDSSQRVRFEIFLPEIKDQRSGIEGLSRVHPRRVHKGGYDSRYIRYSVAKTRINMRTWESLSVSTNQSPGAQYRIRIGHVFNFMFHQARFPFYLVAVIMK